MTRSMNSPSFARMAYNDVSLYRKTFDAGVESAFTLIGSYRCTAFYPLDPDTKMRFALESPVEYLRTFVNNVAIGTFKEGDQLVCNSITYTVKAVGDWAGVISEFAELIVEQDKL